MKDLKFIGLFEDRRVSAAWQCLLTNPKLTVKELASGVGLSESRLEHLMDEYAGMTIREVKRQLKSERLHEARRQLVETTDTILAIRERAGYSYESNFRRDFKKLFKRSPAAFRRRSE
jgi:AraC-like DNA-binding protein